MKYAIVCTLFVFYTYCCFAQKLPTDTSVFGKWLSVKSPIISNNGEYALYTINNEPVNNHTLVIQAIHTNWKMEIPGTGNAAITQDSRMVVFIKPGDTLCLLTLSTSVVEYLPHVSSFQLFKQDGKECLAYQLNDRRKEFVLRDLGTGNHESFTGVTNYLLSHDGNTILLQTESKLDSVITLSLKWVNIPSGNMITIWSTGFGEQEKKASNFVFDASNAQLAYIVQEGVDNDSETSFWYYKAGTSKAIMLVNNQSVGIDHGLRLNNITSFSKDGNRLFFTLKEKEVPTPKRVAVKVDIWSYTDSKLQSQQLYESGQEEQDTYTAVIQIDDQHIFRLQQEVDDSYLRFFDVKSNDITFTCNSRGNWDERNWNANAVSSDATYLINTRNGERIRTDGNFIADVQSGGKYVILLNRDVLSYEIATGVTRNITQFLHIPLVDNEFDDNPGPKPRGLSVVAWLDNEEAVLICDKYDIWKVDPAGRKPAVNLTNGYGRKHNIVFRLTEDKKYRNKFIANNEKLILDAFDRTTKNSGFYSIALGSKGDPELLSMGPYTFRLASSALDTTAYIVERSNASQSPNYFWTSDFKTFTPLSHVYPEAAYNWLSSALITWKTFDGRSTQGVLYKPENFDPKKKYPVIFYYYEKLSDELNKYREPEAAEGWINIPWFVSNGYLVFTPDIHYTTGKPGESAYNSVVSAAKYLAEFPWVDATKMGIQGHSFGGYETNYIVTHTNVFAAAMSASGIADCISGYGSLSKEGGSLQYFYEVDQTRIGATLWGKPSLYIKNSPIFFADKVTTPLLLMNNKEDAVVPFAQGVEFFTALRRLGKKAWMLQYDGEAHSLQDEKAIKDYTIRITQFFDHYLKGALPPKWMTRGISAKMKGIDDGLELDDSIKTPGPGLLSVIK
ncbi:dipeptidyl aminopeptidase/acylaminoacyl peptidase [Chitinophaga niastensis]|uniref:Dipeptidyl aminopeptidase/acylaminoacyl peptidase n=1 Tax=Chitinophaga niastensis TaxID=536980 RepID=A0A2P8HHH9_CHINA|nr:prolyl oligopeptidase family serine peptidase [Chitinophaga niastensis]PSL45688.1 dipeptidyl aminopeptidase/acylaminoacyl peptidase [Chitinophaga niastensis]